MKTCWLLGPAFPLQRREYMGLLKGNPPTSTKCESNIYVIWNLSDDSSKSLSIHLSIPNLTLNLVPTLNVPKWYRRILSRQMLAFFPVQKWWQKTLAGRKMASPAPDAPERRDDRAPTASASAALVPEIVRENWSCFMWCFRNPGLVFLWSKIVCICKCRYIYTWHVSIYIYFSIYLYIYTFTVPHLLRIKDFKQFYDWKLSNPLPGPLLRWEASGADAVWAQCQTYESVGLLGVPPLNQRIFIGWISTFPRPLSVHTGSVKMYIDDDF